MTTQLLKAYHEIRNRKGTEPSWAVHKTNAPTQLVHSTIPFVGKHYAEQDFKILLYASAENLSGYDGYLDDIPYADNRHREWYSSWLNTPKDKRSFYPDVHLQPVTDGSLLLAAYYIASRLSVEYRQDMSPEEFIEKISFGNYGKYSIEGLKNKDYARVKGKLAMSHEYIEEDVRILQPDLIIIPKTIMNTDYKFICELQRLTSKHLNFCGIMQLNKRTLNSNIPNHCRDIGLIPKEYDSLDSSFITWGKNIRGISEQNFQWLFAYLDVAIEETKRGMKGE